MDCQVIIFLALFAMTMGAQTEFGNLIGRFTDLPTLHDVEGAVYAVDERTFYVRGFSYDGTGPAAYFYTGTTPNPANGGIIIPLEDGNLEKLGSYNNEDLLVTLPNGVLRNYNWISIWCESVSVDFGHVKLPPGFTYPSPVSLGYLGENPLVHQVEADDVIVLNSREIQFVRLSYDGAGPGAYFWTGAGTPDSGDTRVPHPANQPNQILPRYSNDAVTIILPEGFTAENVDFIGIWCERVNQNFGHVSTSNFDLTNIPPYIERVETTAPTTSLDNCKVLVPDRFHIAWTIDRSNNKITLEFQGVISLNEYLAFGISGSSSATLMMGSDVAVVWFDPSDSQPRAVDYHLNDYSQCIPEEGIGACPDNIQGGADNVQLISGELKDGLATITIERPLNPSDPLDSEIITTGDVYVSWGIGFINPTGHAAKHEIRTSGDLTVDFGRTSSQCPVLRTSGSSAGSQEPWYRPYLREEGNATFLAVIGPSGGQRGYQGIANQVGWGLAWYINGILIPEIHVVRGNTYTFEIFGGNDRNFLGSYHPFYITDDKDGGYGQKTDAEKQLETIYAPPVEGHLCEYQTGSYQPDAFNDFLSYKSTLKLICPRRTVPGILVWTVDEDTPDTVYYQCYQHKFFGWKIHVSNKTSTTTAPLSFLLVFILAVFTNIFFSD
ncbi:protein Skeletor, isoforms B/C-like [Apostichopus japonicus]|uniref:protein Skeletor, isoforms B/C-like n=1 Tax=Stichopus japonicus TaxID=307972 RepID=UPI003AB711A6